MYQPLKRIPLAVSDDMNQSGEKDNTAIDGKRDDVKSVSR